jgi:hypothetical protein
MTEKLTFVALFTHLSYFSCDTKTKMKTFLKNKYFNQSF